MKQHKLRLTPVQLVAIGFIVIILLGTVLLMCPFSSSEGQSTPLIDALFTATSATCVTGLAVVNTAGYWSFAGKCVILALIQIGGLGAMTIITAILVFFKKQVTLNDSRLLMQSAGSLQMSGVVRLLRYIFAGTLLFELAGALILATQMIPIFGFWKGLFSALFHSVSAFCNAGFDVMGDYAGGSSLSAFDTNPVVNFTVIALVIIGGLGFIVWGDIVSHRFNLKKLEFHSKIVLVTTAFLVLGGTVLLYIFEYNNAFSGLNWIEKAMAALFQAVTPRTAGFETVPMASLSDSGSLLTMILMFIGGSPGSTAGGVKTTTIAVLLISTYASSRKSPQPVAFKRCIDNDTVRQAGSIVMIYVIAIAVSTMIICAVEPFSLKDTLFEVVSAISTTGLSTGITSQLDSTARVILTFLMYAGRIGGLSIAIILSEKHNRAPVSRPTGKLLIG